MEENALLINIAAIIAKDILVDDVKHIKKPPHIPDTNPQLDQSALSSYSLLDSDDEALTFFLKQQNFLCPADKTAPKLINKRKSATNTTGKEGEHKQKKLHANSANAPVRKDPALELNLLNEYDPKSFEDYLHLSKSTFLKIFKSLRHLLTHTSSNLPPQTVFSLALWKLTTDEHFEEIARRFRIPLQSCHLVIRKFWHIVSENYESFIKWPNSQRTQQTTLNDFQSIPALKAFPKLFGIIAIRRLDIFLESEDEEVSVILQIICNAKEKIIDCFVEFSNEYAYDCTPIGQTMDLNAQTIPAGSYIIGDNSFPLRRFLMRPFEIECFRQETTFNRMLLPALTMGQRVLDSMAQRFHIMYALEAKDISEVRKMLETVCSLHNLCIDHQDTYVCSRPGAALTETAVQVTQIKGSEQNQQGRETRLQLMELIVN